MFGGINFYEKSDEDSEVHLIRTNDWMNIHAFPENLKFYRFCLTSGGEVRLLYESL